MEVCVESFFFCKRETKTSSNFATELLTPTHIDSKNRQRHAFPTRPRARRNTGWSGPFFGGTHPMTMMLFFSLSLSLSLLALKTTTTLSRRRLQIIENERSFFLENWNRIFPPRRLWLFWRRTSREKFLRVFSFERLFLSFCLLGCDADLLFSSSSSKYSRCVLRKHRNRSIGLDLTRRRM